MPEIKNSFTAGKMNKDLDERLVPIGEYKHAMNVQVSTSEDSNVGAIENVLGNNLVSIDIVNQTDPQSVCVGSVADEINDYIYYFSSSAASGAPMTPGNHSIFSRQVTGWDNTNAIANAPEHYVWIDRIYRIDASKGSVTPVFVDTYQTKSSFQDGANDVNGTGVGGTNYEYGIKNITGVYPGMRCLFFTTDLHPAVVAGNITANSLVGVPRFESRIVVSVNSSLSTVTFNDNLEDLHAIQPTSPGAPWLDSSVSDQSYLIFIKPRLLNFDCNKLITGINLLDDFLLYTDNYSEPKKINIPRSIAGTSAGGVQPTMLVVPDRNIDITNRILAKEENITVVKKYPISKIKLELSTENPTTAVSNHNFTESDGSGGFVLATPGTVFLARFTNFDNGFEFDENDELRFLNQASTLTLPNNFDVRCKVLQNISGLPLGNTGLTWPSNSYELEILSISPNTSIDISSGPFLIGGTNEFNVSRILDTESLFEKKFVRFGYRWKYQDGEYSTFSPYTSVAFEPSYFEYDSVLGHNKAMVNHLTEVTLRDFVSYNIPDDVVQIDLLYTESNSPVIYVVDKIRFNDKKSISIGGGVGDHNNWTADKYRLKSDLIFNAVPENQTFRQWDNVPRKALAQEITGNRIVYGNYLQNYNIISYDSSQYKKPTLVASYEDRWNIGVNNPIVYGKKVMFSYFFFDKISLISESLNFPGVREDLIEPLEGVPSLKSIRNYQLGFSYLDQYGRETPVFSNNEATVKLPKKEANNNTLLTSRLKQQAPEWATHFKMYVKETSNEYYNLALDRVYKAEDGNLWLSFPSSERNKVDEETFLILKKAADTDVLVQDNAKYKVIAIENEAPDFLKTKTRLLSSASDTISLFTNNAGLLQPNAKTFKIDMAGWANESSVDLTNVEGLMQFDFKDSTGRYSKKYNVVDISDDQSEYTVVLETPILSTEDWLFNAGSTNYIPDLSIRFYKSITRIKPEFDGKFFVKIHGDQIANTFLNTSANSAVEFSVVNALELFYFSCTGAPGIHSSGSEGTTHPVASTTNWDRFTSSGGINPHDGTVGSVTYNFGASNTGLESADGKRDWEQLLDFEPGTSNPLTSNWFIDESYYAGTHPSVSNTSTTSPNHVSGGNADFNYGRGIYEDNGQNYIDISFSMIKEDAGVNGAGINNLGSSNPTINYSDINDDKIWAVGSSSNPAHVDQNQIISLLSSGNKFRFINDGNEVIYTISNTINVTKERRYNYLAWNQVQFFFDRWLTTVSGSPGSMGDPGFLADYGTAWNEFILAQNRRLTYKIPIDKDINSETLIGTQTVTAARRQDAAANANETSVTIQFLEQRTDDDNDSLRSSNPAIFETEPKESIDLDLFYSTGDIYPTTLTIETAEQWIPRGSVVTCDQKPLLMDFNARTFVTGFEVSTSGKFIIKFNIPLRTTPLGASELVFSRPDGGFTTINGLWYTPYTHAANPNEMSAPSLLLSGAIAIPNETGYEIFTGGICTQKLGLSWFNCYSFGNGVESNRLRDDFNQVFVDKGVKVSTTIDEHYEEERRANGLIYSGLFNSISGVNSLNQFIQAEKITKDINPTYGSIQKLFSRQTDLIALCEDKVIRIAANKDAIFNADGNPQLIASSNVLGQVMPFSGEYGISTNPESFSEENYRAYFTDKTRGSVIRLSKDGLTAISDHGMTNFFKQKLKDNKYEKLVGSYDDSKQQYNLTLTNYNCGQDANLAFDYDTLTFSESVRGWTSFKSFRQENGISLNNKYYTFQNSLPYKHHVLNQDRNTFYGSFTPSKVNFLLNQIPGTIKSYKTLNYEGSQANVIQDVAGSIDSNVYQGYDNIQQKDGWFVQSMFTDMQNASLETFVEKEGKWFNYLKGIPVTSIADIDTSEFSFQGIGRATNLAAAVYGCTDPNATIATYNPFANVFIPGSCEYEGCTDSFATNYSVFSFGGSNYYATIDDGSCDYEGCVDNLANNFNYTCGGIDLDPLFLTITTPNNSCCTYPITWDCDTVNGGCMSFSDGSGQYATALDCDNAIGTSGGCAPCGSSSVTGCTDPTAMNYDPTVGICSNAALCVYYQFGCWDQGQLTTTTTNLAGAEIFVPLQTQLDSAASTDFTDVYGTVTSGVVNQAPYEINSYSYTDVIVGSSTFGTTVQVSADNGLNPIAINEAAMDCSCIYSGCMDDGYCTDNPAQFDPSLPLSNPGSQFISTLLHLCPDSGGNSYSSINFGVPSPNYAPWATVDDGTCCRLGCTDPNALNYDPLATCDDGNCNVFSCPTVTMPSYMTNHYPLLSATKLTTKIPDATLEEVLESAFYEDTFGAMAFNQVYQDGEICTSCLDQVNLGSSPTPLGFIPAYDPSVPGSTGSLGYARFHITANNDGFNANLQMSTANFGFGYISMFNGIEELALTLDNLEHGNPTVFEGLSFRIHLQANTNFMSIYSTVQTQLNTPYSIDQSPDYYGIEFSQLDLLLPETGSFWLKNLPLKYLGSRAALDLSTFASTSTYAQNQNIALADCGISHLRLPTSAQYWRTLTIVNDTKYGQRGATNQNPLNGQVYPVFSYNHFENKGESAPAASTFLLNPSPQHQALTDYDSGISNYLCQPIYITELGVSFDASGNTTIEPILMPQCVTPASLQSNNQSCESTPSLPNGYPQGATYGTFNIQSYYDYPYPPWEVQDGSGDIFECTDSFGGNNWNTYSYNATYRTNAAWRQGMHFSQFSVYPGGNTFNPTPDCSGGTYPSPCDYRVLFRPHRGVIRLLNLDKLEDVYIHPSMDPRSFINLYHLGVNNTLDPDGSSGPASQFTDGQPDDQHVLLGSGFTTRGCHQNLKIHVGTTTGGSNTGSLTGRHLSNSSVDVVNTTRVQDWEMVFGTNDPNSEYYIPELTQHFLIYFGPNHKFVD